MVRAFQMARSPQLVWGPGKLAELPTYALRMGQRMLLLTGRTSFLQSPYWPRLQEGLKQRHLAWHHATIGQEPTPALIDQIVEDHQDLDIDFVMAIGGGSVLDAGKAVSAMLCQFGPVKTYLEGVGDRVPSGDKLPFIAVPTTSGTGSEATKNAVISEVGAEGFKKSLRHDAFVPDLALIDPELMLSCPADLTAASGMDAFTQLLESYLSTQANPLTDALAWGGLEAVNQGLHKACQQGDNLEARAQMAFAAYVSGLALANAGLGLVHGFASSVGGRYDIPHGTLCGTLMGAVNHRTLEKLQEDPLAYPDALQKMAWAGCLFANRKKKSDLYYVEYLVEKIRFWTDELNLPRLGAFGVSEAALPELAAATGLKNHPVPLEQEDLIAILEDRL